MHNILQESSMWWIREYKMLSAIQVHLNEHCLETYMDLLSSKVLKKNFLVTKEKLQ